MSLLNGILDSRSIGSRPGVTESVRRLRPDLLLGDRRSARLALGRFAARGGGRLAVACVLASDLPDASAWSDAGPGALAFERESAAAGVELAPGSAGDRSTLALESLAAPGRCFATLGAVPEAGALGALAIEVGELEALELLTAGVIEVEAPAVCRLELSGTLPPRADGHDVAGALIAARPGAFAGAWIEVGGAGLASLSISDRVAMCRTLAAAGARAVLFPCDERTRDDLRRRGREADWRSTEAGEPGAGAIGFDLSWTVPHAVAMARPSRAVPLAWWSGVGVAGVELGEGLPPESLAWCAALLRGRSVAEGTSLRARAWSERAATSADSAATAEAFRSAGARWVREGDLAAWKHRPGKLRLFAGTFRDPAGAGPDDWIVGVPAAIEAACRGRIDPPETWPDPAEVPMPAAGAAQPLVLAALRATGSSAVAAVPSRGDGVNGGEAGGAGAGLRAPAARRGPIALRGAVLGRIEGNLEADSLLPMGPRLESLLADPLRLAEHVVPSIRRGGAPMAPEGATWLLVLGEVRHLGDREAGLLALRAIGVRAILAAGLEPEARGLLARAGILGMRSLRADDLDAIRSGDELELVGGLDSHVPDRARVVRNLTRGFALVALPELGAREWSRVSAAGVA